MIFLIEYKRREGRIVSLDVFDDPERGKAEHARLSKELELNRQGIEHEVVLFDAASEEALRQTHGRYFGDWERFRRIVESSTG